MKVVRTFTHSRLATYDRLKRFYTIDKSRTAKEGRASRDAQLSTEQKAQLKGVIKSIKAVIKHAGSSRKK